MYTYVGAYIVCMSLHSFPYVYVGTAVDCFIIFLHEPYLLRKLQPQSAAFLSFSMPSIKKSFRRELDTLSFFKFDIH